MNTLVSPTVWPGAPPAPGIHAKVAFLRQPASYPGTPARVEIRETHLSWVFLTDHHAYKLKKPAVRELVDHRTLEARRRTCETELALNRCLAPDVYRGMVPLTRSGTGELFLGNGDEVVDWLVKMRRLPANRMLDQAIAARTVTVEDARRTGLVLAAFFRTAPDVEFSPSVYRRRLADEIHDTRLELRRAEFLLPGELFEKVAVAQLGFIAEYSWMFDDRMRAGRIVEAHGDLRPEHVCLERVPVIIDRLEFSHPLRCLDAASELAFLWLECERLGAPETGRLIFETCCQATGDRPPPSLMAFYKRWHACVRAKVAVWHLDDPDVEDAAKWLERARRYLHLAAASLAEDQDRPVVI